MKRDPTLYCARRELLRSYPRFVLGTRISKPLQLIFRKHSLVSAQSWFFHCCSWIPCLRICARNFPLLVFSLVNLFIPEHSIMSRFHSGLLFSRYSRDARTFQTPYKPLNGHVLQNKAINMSSNLLNADWSAAAICLVSLGLTFTLS